SSETAAPYYDEPELTVTYTVVPEPGSASLLLFGAASLLCWRRIRSRRDRSGPKA
ncbi:MAG: PEP-CTERM sorting domain-containing protein, partial [bacterium]|nr:PEP-CTERM sorting domain-containing protein [bacterium]